MKYLFLLIIILFSCNTEKVTRRDNCFPDKGIKKATVTATSHESLAAEKAIYQFNTIGRPTLILEPFRKVELVYDSINLKRTIVYSYGENENEIVDTEKNIVVKNDRLGRPLKIIGSDGNIANFKYIDCSEEIQYYKNSNEEIIHELKSFYENRLLSKTEWIHQRDSLEQITTYFDYELSSSGFWLTRKYKLPNGEIITENRNLEYY